MIKRRMCILGVSYLPNSCALETDFACGKAAVTFRFENWYSTKPHAIQQPSFLCVSLHIVFIRDILFYQDTQVFRK